jgi:hypothetical protein
MTRSGRRGLRNALTGAWVVAAFAGWGVTQWLGEPAATDGPAPAEAPPSGAEPGPQPVHWYDSLCDDPPPSPRPTPPDDGIIHSVVVACAR